nr:cation-translocating P-type ATPase C-terminal domain-containing protein [bacterium]
GNLLKAQFNKPNKYLIDKTMITRMVIMGSVMSFGTIALFNIYKEADYIKATTIAVTVLAIFQWFNAWNCRSEKRSIVRDLFGNRWLIVATVIVVLLQIAAVYVPFMQQLLHTTELSAQEWLITLGVASSIVFVEEIRKFIVRRM